MKNKDPRIDAYILKSEPFAQGILIHLRKLVHKACPGVTETIKWGFPHFEFQGTLCFMASFKRHCTFGFWRADLLSGLKENANKTGEKGMGQFGRISSINDLPENKLILKWVKDAATLNEKGITAINKKKIKKKKIMKVPADLSKLIRENKVVYGNFQRLTPAQKNEYVEWICEAKTEATRIKRQNTMLEWVSEGKPMNWKYHAKYK